MTEWSDSMDHCDCMIPYLEGAGQHSPGCRCFRMEAPAYQDKCNVMRGDGSIPDAVCVLPSGHEGPHYG